MFVAVAVAATVAVPSASVCIVGDVGSIGVAKSIMGGGDPTASDSTAGDSGEVGGVGSRLGGRLGLRFEGLVSVLAPVCLERLRIRVFPLP